MILPLDGHHFDVHYEPGESETATFGGNSNWRGPVWFPMNFLIIEALQRSRLLLRRIVLGGISHWLRPAHQSRLAARQRLAGSLLYSSR